MICRPCAAGADILTDFLGGVGPGPYDPVVAAAELHGRCTGCDCQHGGIRIEFDPGAPGNDLDAMPAQPDTPPAPSAGHARGIVVDATERHVDVRFGQDVVRFPRNRMPGINTGDDLTIGPAVPRDAPGPRGAVTLQLDTGHPLTVHINDRTGHVTGVTLNDNVLPYAVHSSPAAGPGTLDGATVHRIDLIRA